MDRLRRIEPVENLLRRILCRRCGQGADVRSQPAVRSDDAIEPCVRVERIELREEARRRGIERGKHSRMGRAIDRCCQCGERRLQTGLGAVRHLRQQFVAPGIKLRIGVRQRIEQLSHPRRHRFNPLDKSQDIAHRVEDAVDLGENLVNRRGIDDLRDGLFDLLGQWIEQRRRLKRIEFGEKLLHARAERRQRATGAGGLQQELPASLQLRVGGGEQLGRLETVRAIDQRPVGRGQLVADQSRRLEALHLVEQPLRRVLDAGDDGQRTRGHEMVEIVEQWIGDGVEIAGQYRHRGAERCLGGVVQILVDNRFQPVFHRVDQLDHLIGDRRERQRFQRIHDRVNRLLDGVDRGLHLGAVQHTGDAVDDRVQRIDDLVRVERVERGRDGIDSRVNSIARGAEGVFDVAPQLIAELPDLRGQLVAQFGDADPLDRRADRIESGLDVERHAGQRGFDFRGNRLRRARHFRDFVLHRSEIEQADQIAQPIDDRLNFAAHRLDRVRGNRLEGSDQVRQPRRDIGALDQDKHMHQQIEHFPRQRIHQSDDVRRARQHVARHRKPQRVVIVERRVQRSERPRGVASGLECLVKRRQTVRDRIRRRDQLGTTPLRRGGGEGCAQVGQWNGGALAHPVGQCAEARRHLRRDRGSVHGRPGDEGLQRIDEVVEHRHIQREETVAPFIADQQQEKLKQRGGVDRRRHHGQGRVQLLDLRGRGCDAAGRGGLAGWRRRGGGGGGAGTALAPVTPSGQPRRMLSNCWIDFAALTASSRIGFSRSSTSVAISPKRPSTGATTEARSVGASEIAWSSAPPKPPPPSKAGVRNAPKLPISVSMLGVLPSISGPARAIACCNAPACTPRR